MIDEKHPSSVTINVISFNCWGLKYLAKHRNARLSEIGAQIAKATPIPNIVGLQECWTREDYQSIRDQTRHILPYGKFYHSGIFGGGLVILSKWPIQQSNMVRYPLNGRPTAFFRGDWFVGKGIACARIKYGPTSSDIAEVFCTHLHAPYEREPNDSYMCHRTAQAWEIAKLMQGAAERGHLVIGLGDFNMVPLSLAHKLITTHAPVVDTWRVRHPESSLGAAIDPVEKERGLPIPSARLNLQENGATCDGVLNTWRWDEKWQKDLEKGKNILVSEDVLDPKAKRLDYVFAGDGSVLAAKRLNYHTAAPKWELANVRVGMIERHPTLKCSLSDHFSVEATLVRGVPDTDANTISAGSERTPIDSSDLKSLEAPNQEYLPILVYDEILKMIDLYTRRERRQRRLRLSHFLAEIFITIACLVAIWFSPQNFVSFLLMLLGTFGFGAGIIDGLIGGLFVGSELRALKEFEWEIRSTRSAAGGATKGRKCDEEAVIDW